MSRLKKIVESFSNNGQSIVSKEDFQGTPFCHNCKRIACVCNILARHKVGCKFLLAATGAVGIECEHGRDCCPICDPCNCAGV